MTLEVQVKLSEKELYRLLTRQTLPYSIETVRQSKLPFNGESLIERVEFVCRAYGVSIPPTDILESLTFTTLYTHIAAERALQKIKALLEAFNFKTNVALEYVTPMHNVREVIGNNKKEIEDFLKTIQPLHRRKFNTGEIAHGMTFYQLAAEMGELVGD